MPRPVHIPLQVLLVQSDGAETIKTIPTMIDAEPTASKREPKKELNDVYYRIK